MSKEYICKYSYGILYLSTYRLTLAYLTYWYRLTNHCKYRRRRMRIITVRAKLRVRERDRKLHVRLHHRLRRVAQRRRVCGHQRMRTVVQLVRHQRQVHKHPRVVHLPVSPGVHWLCNRLLPKLVFYPITLDSHNVFTIFIFACRFHPALSTLLLIAIVGQYSCL